MLDRARVARGIPVLLVLIGVGAAIVAHRVLDGRNDGNGMGSAAAAAPAPLPPVVQDKINSMTLEKPVTNAIRPVVLPNPGSSDKDRSVHAAASTGTPHPASVSGTVSDLEGAGISGAKVVVAIGAGVEDGATPDRVYAASAGPDGRYRIDGISVFGEALLAASAGGYVAVKTGPRRYASCAPNVRRIDEGKQYMDVDFQLVRARSRLKGRVVDQNRAPVPGARVVVAKQSGYHSSQGWPQTTSDEDGLFALDLPDEGECVLHVKKRGYGVGHFPGIWPGDRNLDLMIYGGGTIAGTVTDEDGNPVPGLDIVISGERAPGDVGNEWESPGEERTATAEDGQYRMDDLNPEFTYRVWAPCKLVEQPDPVLRARSLDQFLSLASYVVTSRQRARLGSTPGTYAGVQDGVEVRAGHVTTVDFVVERDVLQTAAIYGVVTDPASHLPVCPVFVLAASHDVQGDSPLAGMAVSQPDGSYRIECPGITETIAISLRVGYCTETRLFSSAHSRPWDQPEVTTVQLGPGDEVEVNFTLPGTVTVPVRIVSPAGEPLEGIHVHNLTSDSEGRLVLYGLAPCVIHRIQAAIDVPGGYVVCGTSPPFSGKPGQTYDEIEIVCDPATGALTAQIILPEGMDEFPAPRIGCQLYYPDREPVYQLADIAADGYVTLDTVGPGMCSVLLYVLSGDPSLRWWAFVENVEILPDATTHLGDLVPSPPES